MTIHVRTQPCDFNIQVTECDDHNPWDDNKPKYYYAHHLVIRELGGCDDADENAYDCRQHHDDDCLLNFHLLECVRECDVSVPLYVNG